MIYLDVTSSCRSIQNTGMQRMTRKIFAELSERASVTPICWNRLGNSYHLLGPREHKLLVSPFEVHSRPTSRPGFRGQNPVAEFRRLITLPRLDLLNALRAGDIFIAPDTHHDSRRKRLPAILTQAPARSVAIFHDAARSRLKKLYGHRARLHEEYMQCLASFELVLCISQEAENDLRSFWNASGIKPASTSVEPWPIEFGKEVAHRSVNNQTNLVVCVSSLDPRKNHLTLLQAAEKVWSEGLSFELHIIGRAATGFERKVVAQVLRLQKRGRAVKWLRHVDDKTLLREYGACRFTVYPSLIEGFGLPIAESLCHGKPCICGGNGALGETAAGGGCFVVDQTSADALAGGIKELLTDRQLYSRLCQEAGERKFRSWADYIENLLGHLQPALSEPMSL